MHSLLLRWMKRLLMSLGALLLLATLLFIAGNLWVLASTSRYIDGHLEQCRPTDVAIVFGTSHWTRSGLRNPHFHARMRTSARLVVDQRVQHLLLSGDNRTQAYNEPRAMWRDLYRRGVAADQLTMDFAGFSTYDTLVRARTASLAPLAAYQAFIVWPQGSVADLSRRLVGVGGKGCFPQKGELNMYLPITRKLIKNCSKHVHLSLVEFLG